jgi:hypothetical protein
MIKKNTKIIFEGKKGPVNGELEGGIPLTKGEVIKFHVDNNIQEYVVKEKNIECFLKGKDQIINITYLLGKN